MDPDLVLRDTLLQVRPGDIARTSATVRNTSDLVEQYDFDVLGPATAWAEVIPRSISVIQNGELDVQIQFRPPVGPGTPSGSVPFALRCASRENPDNRAVVEGDLVVGAIYELVASLTPPICRGRWAGRWTAQFDNRGTAPVRLRLAASDERRALGLALAPNEIEIGPGASGRAFLKARPKRPTLLGAMARHRVRLTYARLAAPGDTGAEGFVDVTFEHVPVMSRAVAALAAVAIVGGVVAALLLSQPKATDDIAQVGLPLSSVPAAPAAEPGGAGIVRLSWPSLPGATGYRVEKLANNDPSLVEASSTTIEAPVRAHEWGGLPDGSEACFRLVALNEFGPSQPSEPACGVAGTGPSATDTPTPGQNPTPDATPTSTDTVTPTPTPTATGTATVREPRGAYVVYTIFQKKDQPNFDDQQPLKRATEIENALGDVTVVIADAAQSQRLTAAYPVGGVVLYTDGFTTAQDAQQFCARTASTLSTIDLPRCRAHGTQ